MPLWKSRKILRLKRVSSQGQQDDDGATLLLVLLHRRHHGFTTNPRFTTKRKMNTAAVMHTSTAMSDASTPNSPPEIQIGPLTVPSTRPVVGWP